jgi:hypothetical protein
MDVQRRARRRQRHHEPDQHEQIEESRPTDHDQCHGTGQPEGGDGQPCDARDIAPKHAIPGGRPGDEHAAEHAQAAGELADRHGNGEDERGRPHHQRGHRRQPSPHRTLLPAAGLPVQAGRPTRASRYVPVAQSSRSRGPRASSRWHEIPPRSGWFSRADAAAAPVIPWRRRTAPPVRARVSPRPGRSPSAGPCRADVARTSGHSGLRAARRSGRGRRPRGPRSGRSPER